MTKAKKVLSFCLAVVMVIGMFAFGAFAAGENATISVTVDQASVKTGDIVNVTVKLTTDYFVGPLQLPIHYDPAVLQYVDSSANPADVFGANGATKTVVSQTNNGCVQFGFVPVTDKGAVSQKLTDYQIVTFQLKAVADGSSEVALHAADQKSPTNTGGLLYVGSFSSSSVDETANPIGQALTLNGTTVTVGGTTAVPELQLSAHGQSIGAVINRTLCTSDTDSMGNPFSGCVMGIDTLGVYNMETLSDCLSTPAGSITINTDETVGACETTGAVIELRDTTGAIVERYVFIYFGDIDTDGVITSGDGTICADYEATYEGLNSDYLLMSADIDGDQMIMSGDGTILADYELTYDAGASFYQSQADIAQLYA